MIEVDLGLQIAAVAESWVKAKVQYLHRGTSRIGCDCTGLLIGVMQELGYLANYKLRKYSLDWNLHSGADEYVCSELARMGNPLVKLNVRAGDVVVFKFGRCNSHAGIVINRKIFAHSHIGGGRCSFGMLRNSPWFYRWTLSYRWDIAKITAYK